MSAPYRFLLIVSGLLIGLAMGDTANSQTEQEIRLPIAKAYGFQYDGPPKTGWTTLLDSPAGAVENQSRWSNRSAGSLRRSPCRTPKAGRSDSALCGLTVPRSSSFSGTTAECSAASTSRS